LFGISIREGYINPCTVHHLANKRELWWYSGFSRCATLELSRYVSVTIGDEVDSNDKD